MKTENHDYKSGEFSHRIDTHFQNAQRHPLSASSHHHDTHAMSSSLPNHRYHHSSHLPAQNELSFLRPAGNNHHAQQHRAHHHHHYQDQHNTFHDVDLASTSHVDDDTSANFDSEDVSLASEKFDPSPLMELSSLSKNEINVIPQQSTKFSREAKVAPEIAEDKGTIMTGTISEDSPVDCARLNFSKKSYFIPFVIFSFLLALVEAILVAWPPTDVLQLIQLIILSISTFLFVVGLHITAVNVDDLTLTYPEKVTEVIDGEVVLELICIGIGWACFHHAPGLAALRCFRVLRYLWYLELFIPELPDGYDPEEHFFSLVKAVQLCLQYMEALGAEILSEKSRGGIVVLLLLFFLAYIFAVVFSTELGTLDTVEGTTCATVSSCFVIMIRLAFCDGVGLDFLSAVMENSSGLSVLLFLYLIATNIILLNGLIGIFASAFVGANAFDEPSTIDDEGDGGGLRTTSLSPQQLLQNRSDGKFIAAVHKLARKIRNRTSMFKKATLSLQDRVFIIKQQLSYVYCIYCISSSHFLHNTQFILTRD